MLSKDTDSWQYNMLYCEQIGVIRKSTIYTNIIFTGILTNE